MHSISLQQQSPLGSLLESLKSFWKDPRNQQITFQSIFLAYGLYILDWNVQSHVFILTVITALLVQAIFAAKHNLDLSSLKSALISSLSLCLIIRANAVETMMIASALTISSKFLIRYQGKHIFNPTSFGILATVLITGDAWISPGQWGSNWLLIAFVGICGLNVLSSVRRIETSLAFLITFAGLHFFRDVVYLGWTSDVVLHKLSSGTLLLFAFFMITDPKTTPNARKARIIWATVIGIISFILSTKLQVYTAPIWALVITAPFTLLLDKKFVHPKFQWK